MDFFTIENGRFAVCDDLNFSKAFVKNAEIVVDITYTEEQEEPDSSPEYPSIEGVDTGSPLPPPKPLEWRLVISKEKDAEWAVVAYQFPYILERGEFMPPSCICNHEMCTQILFEACPTDTLRRFKICEIFESKKFRETITFKGYKFLCGTLFSEKYEHIWSTKIDKCD